MTISERKLIEALEAIDQGADQNLVISKLPESLRSEALDLVNISSLMASMPKSPAPTPIKQFRFNQNKATRLSFKMFRLAQYSFAPLTILAMIFSGGIAVKASQSSLPGDILYPVKRATETARVSLSVSEAKSAKLHVELANKRVEEAIAMLEKPGSDIKDQQAAIQELVSQSEKTFEVATKIAASTALLNGDTSLLENLKQLTESQKNVITEADKLEVKPEESVKVAIKSVEENEKTLAKLFATASEQSLADVSKKISLTGKISSLNSKSLVVEKNAFTISDDTEIINSEGEKLLQIDQLADTASITGFKSGSQTWTATQIKILTTKPEVAAAKAVPSIKSSSTKPSISPTAKPLAKPVEAEPTSSPTPEPTPFQPAASIIAEPAELQ